ncbi:mannitol dehydrogenase family protein [Bacillus pseudomycoides]|uniref:mannitol dehydrogenase family protein n=1 Tax=Bacillus pseudomycoides TaxID=64104 RepID=UPI003D1D56BA
MVYLKTWQDAKEILVKKQVELPEFDIEVLKKSGKESPVWLHFGGGNLYRSFHAEVAQRLANKGELKNGVVVCETFDKYVIDDVYTPYNNDLLQVVMHEDGTLEKRIIAATADSYYCNPERQESFAKVQGFFADPALQFTTFTITEKGYVLNGPDGSMSKVIAEDLKMGPKKPKHTMSIVTSLLLKRFEAGAFPIAMISTDNFSQNGRRFKNSILAIAKGWQENAFVPQAFIDYLSDEQQVSFPWSMIDRITPNPSESVERDLAKDGFEDLMIVHTSNHTNIAPFTNTEVVHYLVVEDSFPNGRPDLTAGGVILTDRKTVDKADTMKVTTCLNPLHTALAVFGCLLGYTSIAAEMKDSDLVGLIKEIGYHEGLPVVSDPKIINPKKFIDEVIEKRLPNSYIPDTPQRIVTDTSQKIAIRYGQTIKEYQTDATKNTSSLTFIPLTIAAWLRYLLAIDDRGNSFTPSPDPLLETLQENLEGITLGTTDAAQVHTAVAPILANKEIFDVNLYEVGLGEKIEAAFLEMLSGKEAVRNTLHRYLAEKGGN